MHNLKNYCPLPFGFVLVDSLNEYQICCRHNISDSNGNKSMTDTSLNEWFNGSYVESVRQSFIEDRQHPGCKRCWDEEKSGFTSLRQDSILEHKLLKTSVDAPKVRAAEIQMGNTCNLGCLMCSSKNSSFINAENKKLGLDTVNQKDYNFTRDKKKHILDLVNDSEVKLLSFRGGEPLYSKLIYETLNELPDDRKKNLLLHITTNATVWNDDWKTLFSKFGLVRFMFSLDATDKLYNYIRYPGNWETVKNNLLEINKEPNAKSLINCVVQNLNIMNLRDLVVFANKHNIYLQLKLATTPAYMFYTNLPKDKISIAIVRLKEILEIDLKQKNLYDVVKNLITNLEQQLDSDQPHPQWQNFVTYISKKDQHRGKNFWDYLT